MPPRIAPGEDFYVGQPYDIFKESNAESKGLLEAVKQKLFNNEEPVYETDFEGIYKEKAKAIHINKLNPIKFNFEHWIDACRIPSGKLHMTVRFRPRPGDVYKDTEAEMLTENAWLIDGFMMNLI
jgi:hypothetical protein